MAAGMVRSHAQHDDRYQIGQQIAQHDAADGGADAAGSHVVITVADDQDLVADKARHGDPARDGHAQDQGLDAGRRDIGDQDQDDGGRNVITDVVQLGEEEIELADIAPEHAHRDAHHGLDEGHEEGDGQTGACTGPDAGPQVLADGIGAPDKALFPGRYCGTGYRWQSPPGRGWDLPDRADKAAKRQSPPRTPVQ